MSTRLVSFTAALLFNLICLSLVATVVLYKTDFTFAQANAEQSDAAVLIPRDTEIAKDDDDDNDDDDGVDPPTDNDGYDTPAPTDDDSAEINASQTYTVQPGDTLWQIARKLGVPFASLAAQTSNPSRIVSGQKFTYTSGNSKDVSISTNNNVDDTSGLQTYVFTVRPGDTLSHIAQHLGVPLETLAAQTGNQSLIYPGQEFHYVSEQKIDTPPLFTDNDGTDSDGIDTTGQFTDNDGIDTTGQFTDNDGIDTTGQFTDNDGTDSDGIDTTGQFTDNDGTDSDGIDTTGQFTDNDGTDSDGIDTTGQFTDNDGTDSDGIDTTGQLSDNDSDDSDDDSD